MTEQDRWTIGRLLQWTTDYLKKGGSPSPRLDAEVLLAEARGCQRIQLYTAFEEEAGDDLRSRFRELVRRRAGGEPVAYLVGRREFFSLPFHVTSAVLIPRPETESVVIAALDAIREWGAKGGEPERGQLEVADVGTGSGAIAISIAKHASNCRLTAIDLSPDALEVARGNATTLGVADRIEFFHGDLFAAVPADRQFAVIASNPPYVAENEVELMAAETRQYEPKLALIAGPTGVEVISRLLTQAADRLLPGGSLILEISPMIHAKVLERFAAENAYREPKTIKDLAGHARVIVAKRA